MVSVNKINAVQVVQTATGLVPVFLSILFLVHKIWWILPLCIFSLFLIVATVPLFKKRESLCMFLLVAVTGFPLNIKLAYWLIDDLYFGMDFFIGDLCYGMLICCILFSIEEIVFGVITRLIWKRQYKIKL